MKRSSLVFLGSLVFAAAGLSMTTVAPAIAQVGQTTGNLPLSGRNLLSQAEDDTAQLPTAVAEAVLKDAAQRTGMQSSDLTILQVAKQTWSNGCLELAEAGVACTEALVPGWLVLVGSAKEQGFWVYRTNESGTVVKWDETATQTLTARLRSESTTTGQQTTTRRTETTEQRSTVRTEQRSTVAMTESAGNFSLAVLQPAGSLTEVITRVSVKSKQGNSYSQEQYLGDFRYKIKQKAKFVKGVNPGDRVVVRLYDQNRLIGYSEFECLSENAAVNLILSENPSETRVVRTVYGIDADMDGNIDSGTTAYNYYTQIDSQERVTFLSSVEQINVSQFQSSEISTSAATSVYSSSFTSGESMLAGETMSVYSSGMAALLTSAPGQLVQVIGVEAENATYEVSQLLARYANVGVTRNIQTSFPDVPQGYWAKDFIAQLAELEIIEGFPDGRFRPDQPVTRAQFAAMLRKAFEMNKVRNAIAFRDVSSDYWAYSAIQEAYEMGFLGAVSSNAFNPTQKLSRLDILVALAKGMNYSSASTTTQTLLQVYSDAASIPSDVRSLVAAATERGLVVNYPNVQSLKPNQVATRAEVCAFLYQALVSTGKAQNIASPYVAGEGAKPPTVREVDTPKPENVPGDNREVEGNERTNQRQNCNQGVGNGPEGCDPGNSNRNQPSNDEGAGAAPGSPGRQGR
ncbi:S-layer homology domain-containing protein [Trichocoleus sp. ST-U3]|uniref:S-layer homology domain-containing protein n=1 Tax=Coleofasciculus sp. FACHB-542 TaxID=2692787 RepID=UPI001686C8CA|nr:S-layer homology domain-containing protein [Coleofasciculus sp. FACHB-542]MBD2085068.1 S-layer homology domain-containing protein [Coleofasciculus sp. FACHB-542]